MSGISQQFVGNPFFRCILYDRFDLYFYDKLSCHTQKKAMVNYPFFTVTIPGHHLMVLCIQFVQLTTRCSTRSEVKSTKEKH